MEGAYASITLSAVAFVKEPGSAFVAAACGQQPPAQTSAPDRNAAARPGTTAAAPPAPALAESGRLLVRSTPAGARVFVDGRDVGTTPQTVRGRVLTAPSIDAHNTFEQPEAVKPADFNAAQLKDGVLQVNLPAKCVVILEL